MEKKLNLKMDIPKGYNVPPDEFKGCYANATVIRNNKREFVFDFILRIENVSVLVSRVIMSPDHTKEFKAALQRNIENFALKPKLKGLTVKDLGITKDEN